MSTETGSTAETVTTAAGPLDVALLRYRALVAGMMRLIPRPVWIVVVIVVVLVSAVMAMINSANPMGTVLLLITFALVIIQGLVFVRTRTLSARTVLSVAAAGASVVMVATIITSGGVATLFDYVVLRGPFPVWDPWVSTFWVPIASEVCKLLPLLAILLWSRRARTMTIGDCLMVGLMAGNGFALTEEITRSGGADCDYLPDLLRIPIGITPCASGTDGYTHVAATAISAAAIGFWWRARRRRQHEAVFGGLAVLALGWVIVGHMAVNAEEAPTGGVGDPWETITTTVGATAAMVYVMLGD